MSKKSMTNTESKVKETFEKMDETVDKTMADNQETKPTEIKINKKVTEDLSVTGKLKETEDTEEPQVTEEPKTEEPQVTEEPKTEEPKTEEPKVEEPKTEEPKTEEPKVEEPKVEEPKVEEPKVEEPKNFFLDDDDDDDEEKDLDPDVELEKLFKDANYYRHLACGRHLKDRTPKNLEKFYKEFISYGISSATDIRVLELLKNKNKK